MTSPTTRTRALAVSGGFMPSFGQEISRLAPYRVILEAVGLHDRRIVKVAPVEDRRRLELRLDRGEVRAAKLLPLGHDGERVRALQRGHGRIHHLQAALLGEYPLRFRAR